MQDVAGARGAEGGEGMRLPLLLPGGARSKRRGTGEFWESKRLTRERQRLRKQKRGGERATETEREREKHEGESTTDRDRESGRDW